MAKTIKFNLICDNHSVRTLDDLRENFSIEDILSYYRSGLLVRWLDVRGYEEEKKKVEAIGEKEDAEIARQLVDIFQLEGTEDSFEQCLRALEYKQEREKLQKECEQRSADAMQVFDTYKKGFESVIQNILNHAADMAHIKAAVEELDTTYRELFDMNHSRILSLFLHDTPKAVFAMLMKPHMRETYLPIVLQNREKKFYEGADRNKKNRSYHYSTDSTDSSNESGINILDYDAMLKECKDDSGMKAQAANYLKSEFCWEQQENLDGNALIQDVIQSLVAGYIQITTLLHDEVQVKEVLGNDLKLFKGETDQYWKDIESKDGKYMILKIQEGDIIRSTGDREHELDAAHVNGRFPILDGIDYKSNDAAHEVWYLEV